MAKLYYGTRGAQSERWTRTPAARGYARVQPIILELHYACLVMMVMGGSGPGPGPGPGEANGADGLTGTDNIRTHKLTQTRMQYYT